MKENKFTLQMPLVEAMLKYKADNVYPLHTPGHKGGRGMERLLRQELGGSVAMDVSLMSELDDIHEPETYIKEAQELAAQTYKTSYREKNISHPFYFFSSSTSMYCCFLIC